MIEKTILDYLNSKLPVSAFMEKPEEPHEEYVLLLLTGGGESNHIRTALMAVQSYAPTLYQAAMLNELVIDTMQEAVSLPNISRVDVNSYYNFTNTAKKEHRYQAVFEITYHKGVD